MDHLRKKRSLKGTTPWRWLALVAYSILLTEAAMASSIAPDWQSAAAQSMLACAVEAFDATRVSLLVNWSNVNTRGGDGQTPLMVVAAKGSVEQVRHLIKLGAHVGDRSNHGETALSYSAEFDQSGRVTAALLKAGAVVNPRDNFARTPLFIACENDNPIVAELLIRCGADINAVDESGDSCLITAARRGEVRIEEDLVTAGANVAVHSLGGRTAWSYATCFPLTVAMVRRLAPDKADIDAVNDDGCTALMYASQRGEVDVIRYLLARRADANCIDLNGQSVLDHGCLSTDTTVIGLLIHSGAQVRAAVGGNQRTALAFACEHGAVAACRALLNGGADVNSMDVSGERPLMAAAASGNVDAVKLILDRGGVIDAEDNDGDTALLYAVRAGSEDGARMLLRAGAAVTHRDNLGRGCALYACRNADPGLLKALLDEHADLSYHGDNGDEALWQALNIPVFEAKALKPGLWSIEDTVRTILQATGWRRPAKPDTDPILRSFSAQLSRHNDLLVYLRGSYDVILGAGADVNAAGKDGATSLILASRAGLADSVSYLISRRADVNLQDKSGYTALHSCLIAARSAGGPAMTELYRAVARSLVRAGADTAAKTLDGRDAPALARDANDSELVRIVESGRAGASSSREH